MIKLQIAYTASLSYSYLWSVNFSPSTSGLSVPAVANMTVVSRSLTIPLRVVAALMQAWVPRDPDCRAASI